MAARKDSHQHHDLAARLIKELRSYGLPQRSVSKFLEWVQAEKILDLGGQGYSIDTLQRHYPLALAMGAQPTKQMLLMQMNALALGEFDFGKASDDAKLRVMYDALKWTLEKPYGLGSQPRVGKKTEKVPIELLAEILDDEEMIWLERIMRKIQQHQQPASQQVIEG